MPGFMINAELYGLDGEYISLNGLNGVELLEGVRKVFKDFVLKIKEKRYSELTSEQIYTLLDQCTIRSEDGRYTYYDWCLGEDRVLVLKRDKDERIDVGSIVGEDVQEIIDKEKFTIEIPKKIKVVEEIGCRYHKDDLGIVLVSGGKRKVHEIEVFKDEEGNYDLGKSKVIKEHVIDEIDEK